jgi:multiple sugar transport system permease protein
MTTTKVRPLALGPGGQGTPFTPRRGGNKRGRQWLIYSALIVAGAATMLPFVWMVLSSFKTQGEILRNPTGFLPSDPTWGNYAKWFTELDIQKFFVNSLLVAVVTVLGNLVFCSMVGYALAKMDFPGKRVLFALVMITLMTPHCSCRS